MARRIADLKLGRDIEACHHPCVKNEKVPGDLVGDGGKDGPVADSPAGLQGAREVHLQRVRSGMCLAAERAGTDGISRHARWTRLVVEFPATAEELRRARLAS